MTMKIKTFLIVSILIILLILSGCAKKDLNGPQTQNNILSENVVGDSLNISELDEESLELESFEETSEDLIFSGTQDTSTENNSYGLSKVDESTNYQYYSQVDSRWKNHPYTIRNDKSQTVGSSGCGPTSAAMVVSSLTGTSGQYKITPDELADIYVDKGFRTKNSGTYYSAFQWTASYFNLEYKRAYSIDSMIQLLKDNYMVIISCSRGLFTYNGHFIVAYGLDGDNIKIFDPYLYNNKFNTSDRSGKVTIKNNTVYCSIANFKKYANSKAYFGYKGINSNKLNGGNIETNINPTNKSYTMYVKTKSSNLNVRLSNSTNSKIVGSLTKNSPVTVEETNSGWSRISYPVSGWVSSAYLSYNQVHVSSNTYTIGNYKTKSNVRVRSGAGTNFTYKKYNLLTSNARYQNKRLGNYYYNGYLKGVTFTVTKVIKVNGYYWGKCASGYVRLDNCYKLGG